MVNKHEREIRAQRHRHVGSRDALEHRRQQPQDQNGDDQTDRLFWPVDIPHAKSRSLAFNTLFASWDMVYQAELGIPPCEQAVSQGLACLDRQGSLGSLRHLNRPAVLQLVDQQGRRFYAPLLKLTDNKASLIINAKEVTVSTTGLEKQWPRKRGFSR